MKIIIFDASTLITLAMNGLFDEFVALKKIFDGKFIITKEVKYESIDRPSTIKKFELESLKIRKLLDEGVLEMPSSLKVNDNEITNLAMKMLETANKIFSEHGKDIHLLDTGECSCLALSRILSKRDIANAIAVDERTTRMLVEKPENLEKLLEVKLHTKIKLNKENLKLFNGFKVIRSSELVYVAYKKGLVNLKKGAVLEALLYAVKFKGCSISEEEIKEILKIG